MARPTNTFSTFEAIGNREDLKDFIANISPTDTPFSSMAGKAKAQNVYFEWQTDALAPPNTSNAQIEADDTTIAAVTPTVRVGNRTQISNASVVISRTQETVQKAGRSSELAYQITKKTKELKRDIEAILTQNQASAAGNATTARKTGSLEAWFTTNVSRGGGASGGFSGGTVSAATDGTQRAFTESLLKTVAQAVYSAGGDADTLMVGPAQKQVVSSFTGNNTRTQDTSDGKLSTAIKVYESDFGDLKIVTNRFQRNRTAFVLQSDMWQIAWLDPIRVEDLAKTGDSMKKLLVGEYGLLSRNEAASGVIADLS
jgi:Family of unknown function (DUF5309)